MRALLAILILTGLATTYAHNHIELVQRTHPQQNDWNFSYVTITGVPVAGWGADDFQPGLQWVCFDITGKFGPWFTLRAWADLSKVRIASGEPFPDREIDYDFWEWRRQDSLEYFNDFYESLGWLTADWDDEKLYTMYPEAFEEKFGFPPKYAVSLYSSVAADALLFNNDELQGASVAYTFGEGEQSIVHDTDYPEWYQINNQPENEHMIYAELEESIRFTRWAIKYPTKVIFQFGDALGPPHAARATSNTYFVEFDLTGLKGYLQQLGCVDPLAAINSKRFGPDD